MSRPASTIRCTNAVRTQRAPDLVTSKGDSRPVCGAQPLASWDPAVSRRQGQTPREQCGFCRLFAPRLAGLTSSDSDRSRSPEKGIGGCTRQDLNLGFSVLAVRGDYSGKGISELSFLVTGGPKEGCNCCNSYSPASDFEMERRQHVPSGFKMLPCIGKLATAISKSFQPFLVSVLEPKPGRVVVLSSNSKSR
jgi:hypothetical protein